MADERGQAGGIEAIAFGLLIFVVGSLLLASAWAVVDAKFAVVAAAREAARTYVEAPSSRAASTSARAAALDAMRGHGRGDDVTVELDAPAAFRRCAPVTARVSVVVPAAPLPWVGGLGAITVTARHTERIDPFRAGVPGAAACPP
jgi:hypothetical protein